jgi:uncharacterized protein YhdP
MPLASTIAPSPLSTESSIKAPSFGLRLWHGVATTCLVATALFWVLVCGMAVVLHSWVVPNIDSLKPHIESWVSQQIEAKLTIGSITAVREGWLPRFDVSNVSVTTRQADGVPLEGIHLGRVQISVSPMRLLQGQLDRLEVDAPELEATRDANGRITIAGFVLDPKAPSGAGLDWLMSQREIVIEGGTLHWQDDALRQPRATLTDFSFVLRNGLRSHQAALSATPPPQWGQHIRMVATLTQPLLERRAGRWQSWQGQVYAKLLAPLPEQALRATVAKPLPAWLSTAKLFDRTQQLEIWTDVADAAVESISLVAQHIPHLATRLQAQYDPARRTLRVAGTQIQTTQLLAATIPWLKVIPLDKDKDPQNTRSIGTDFLSQGPLAAAARNGVIERLQLKIQDLSTASIDASFNNPDAAGDIKGTWDKTASPSGLLDITARLSRFDLSAAHRYLPASTPQATRQYLHSALLAGQASDLAIRLKGALTGTPLDVGLIQVSGTLQGVQLALSPNWPQLTQTKARVEMLGSSLEIRHIEALLGDLPLTGSIRVADLQHPIVDVSVEAPKTPLASALALLNQTSAGSTALSQAQATGSVDLKAQLSLPLANLRSSHYLGQAQLNGATLLIQPQAPWLTHMKGQISFSDAGLALQNVRAQLLGGEISLSGMQGRIKGQGHINMAALRAWQPRFDALLSKASGQVAYTVAIAQGAANTNTAVGAGVGAGAGASTNTSIQIDTNLIGLALDLPAPLFKTADTPWPTHFGQSTQGLLSLTVGDILDAQLQPKGADWYGHVAVGQKAPSSDLTQPGIGLSIQLPQLDISAWQAALANGASPSETAAAATVTNSSTAEGAGARASRFELPRKVSAQIQDLVWKDRHFEQVVLGASAGTGKSTGTWRVNAQANDFNGYAEYRTGTAQTQPQLYARLARLAVPDASSTARIEQILDAPQTSLPGLDIVIEDFELVGKKLGRLEVIATNQRALGQLSTAGSDPWQSEWRLQKLALINPDAALNASGVWSKPRRNERAKVDLQFNWSIENSGDLLTRLGLPGTIKNGKGQLQGRVGWLGSPLGLHYPSLAGLVKLDMVQGQFLKIDPGVGRLLSVLSLQALPRRLTLDFRDVFSEGFAFDAINGDARIQEGVLDTENLQMKSVLALVSLQGSVDLAKETQNLRVLVLPDLNAGGASLLAAIINPVIGAVTYLAQWVLRRPAVAAATKAYKIEGSWRAPVVTSVAP